MHGRSATARQQPPGIRASADAVLCQRTNAIRNQQSTMAGKLMCGHAYLQSMMEGG